MAKKLKRVSRDQYLEQYNADRMAMFTKCYIPNVGDFAKAFGEKNKTSMKKIENITEFTGNTKDIANSVNRRTDNYSEEESNKFMKQVISANVTDITASGYFWKKLASSCDGMSIDIADCKSEGVEFKMPVDEDTFNYKIRNHWVMELDRYVEDYSELPKRGTIHIRNFLTCTHGIRHFCAKCAGLYRREWDSTFVPINIGEWATYMITEYATQGALDAMNKGTSERINVLLEQKIPKIKNIAEAKEKIQEIIDQIGNVGVESRFYEVALLSRWRNGKFAALQTSFLQQGDKFGAFIYKPTQQSFEKLLVAGTFEANSVKTEIATDRYKGAKKV